MEGVAEMLMFTVPRLIICGILAAFPLALSVAAMWHSIPRANADFELVDVRHGARHSGANPAGEFYSGSVAAQAMGAALRGVERFAPAWVTTAALRLFFTPLPWKIAARKTVPSRWEVG